MAGIALSLTYDMRAPDFGAPATRLYKAALDQCEWADRLGFSTIELNEHHASNDGYLPSPIVLGAAIAARTHRVLIELNILTLPLYHPLRAAEDLAVLDLISGGRMRLIVGAGYRVEEYAQFGLDLRRRPALMERGVETLKRAWSGESFEFEGQTVRVLPRPAQRPRPQIMLGGSSRAAARRAARIADGYRPVTPELYQDYLDALRDLGKPAPPAPAPRGQYRFLHVSHDPEGDWQRIAPHALHESNDYAEWLKADTNAVYSKAQSADELRASGAYRILTPDECVALARRDGSLRFKPLIGGLDPDIGWEGLRLFEREVLPRL